MWSGQASGGQHRTTERKREGKDGVLPLDHFESSAQALKDRHMKILADVWGDETGQAPSLPKSDAGPWLAVQVTSVTLTLGQRVAMLAGNASQTQEGVEKDSTAAHLRSEQ